MPEDRKTIVSKRPDGAHLAPFAAMLADWLRNPAFQKLMALGFTTRIPRRDAAS